VLSLGIDTFWYFIKNATQITGRGRSIFSQSLPQGVVAQAKSIINLSRGGLPKIESL